MALKCRQRSEIWWWLSDDGDHHSVLTYYNGSNIEGALYGNGI